MGKFKANVTVMLKGGVLDPQGSAVERALKTHGYTNVANVRIGKMIDFEIEASSKDDAQKTAVKLSDALLANPVMENYSINIEELA